MEKSSIPSEQYDAFQDLTGTIQGEKNAETEDIGKRLNFIRNEKQLSLEALARLTGFDKKVLHQIEQNEIQPQIGTILKLSKALNKAFGLKDFQPGPQQVAVTRKSDQQPITRATSSSDSDPLYTYKTLAPNVSDRHMEPLIVQLTETPDAELSIHNGEEFIYVLSGTVELLTGKDVILLDPGDSAYYSSTLPHRVAAKKDQAMILAVIYESFPNDSSK
ncbi:MAG: helix-turn-helix transcriptional regulator [Candidatus Magnetomorum sp.]|nr:helix-turn-helix transcriptional regulator [Candidatus Magnetomorum sp.]